MGYTTVQMTPLRSSSGDLLVLYPTGLSKLTPI